MHFVSFQTVAEMYLLLSRISKQMHLMVIWSPKNAFCEHSNCPKCIVASGIGKPNAFKWSLEHKKMHFVSIQTVPKMHLFLSRIGKQIH